jgi:amino-acid N-acetyltransferase
MTQHLINTPTQPLYLECLGQGLAKFYSRLGFVQITFADLPPGLKRKFAFSELVRKLLRMLVVFMHWQK